MDGVYGISILSCGGIGQDQFGAIGITLEAQIGEYVACFSQGIGTCSCELIITIFPLTAIFYIAKRKLDGCGFIFYTPGIFDGFINYLLGCELFFLLFAGVGNYQNTD
tara:strand:- start:758 stop:1081 length:324 start_codon:yes stop_codon:yes gene_type:complete